MFDAEALIIALTVFVLAIFIGYEVITKVPPTRSVILILSFQRLKKLQKNFQ